MIDIQERIIIAQEKKKEKKLMLEMFLKQNKKFLDKNGIPKFGTNRKEFIKKWEEFKRFWRTGGN